MGLFFFFFKQIVLEGNQAFLRNPMVVECGQVVATHTWKCRTRGPLPQIVNVWWTGASRKVIYLLCAVVWLSVMSVWLLQYDLKAMDPPKTVGLYSTNGAILPCCGLAGRGALGDGDSDQETPVKRSWVFTSMSVATQTKWITDGNTTQITTMAQGRFLERAKERGVGKSCVL